MLAVCGSAALLAGLIGAAPASADTAYYHYGSWQTIQSGLPWVTGPAHSLTQNVGFVTGTLCVGAIDVNGGNLAANPICGTWGPATNVIQSYCGCILRDGAIYPFGSGSGQVWSANESW